MAAEKDKNKTAGERVQEEESASTALATEGAETPGAQAGARQDGPALLAKLDAIEGLLRQQAESNRKISRSRTVMSVLMACLVLVFAVGLLWLNVTVSSATEQLPVLLSTADETLRQAERALASINTLDIAALNGAIEEMGAGLGAVDFQALNGSILDLQTVAEGLAGFMSIFGR